MTTALSLPTIACLAIAGCAKLNCRRQDIGFEPNSCMAFVNFPDILRNVGGRFDAKRDTGLRLLNCTVSFVSDSSRYSGTTK